jgi:hypothetical protein
MTGIEDPAPPPSTQTADEAEPRDDLEHWLSDIRTDVAANPSDWIDGEDPTGEAADPLPPPLEKPETGGSEPGAGDPAPRAVGRHRSPD